MDPEETKSEDDSELREVKTEEIPMQQSHFSGNLEELDETVKSMMVKSTNFAVNRKTFADICKVCGKEGLGSNIKNHIEVNHLDNIQNPFEGHLKKFRTFFCRSIIWTASLFRANIVPTHSRLELLSECMKTDSMHSDFCVQFYR